MGRFLLRIRDTLTTIAPLANSPAETHSRNTPSSRPKRRIGGILLSPDADLLIIETLERVEPSGLEDAPDQALRPLTYRRLGPPSRTDQLLQPDALGRAIGSTLQLARRHVRACHRTHSRPTPLASLAVVDQGQSALGLRLPHLRRQEERASPLRLHLPSRPDLCQPTASSSPSAAASHTPQQIGGFNMRGEEMWEQGMLRRLHRALLRIRTSRRALRPQPHAYTYLNGDRSESSRLSGQRLRALSSIRPTPARQLLRVDCHPCRSRRPELRPLPRRLEPCRHSHRRHRDLQPPTAHRQRERSRQASRGLSPPTGRLAFVGSLVESVPGPSDASATTGLRNPSSRPR